MLQRAGNENAWSLMEREIFPGVRKGGPRNGHQLAHLGLVAYKTRVQSTRKSRENEPQRVVLLQWASSDFSP